MGKCEVGKDTGIGNTNKEKDFLKGKIDDIRAKEIFFIKAPNTHVGKNAVPDKKDDTDGDCRYGKVFPGFWKVSFLVKAKRKRYWNRAEVNKEV